MEATVTPVDQRQPVNLYDAARDCDGRCARCQRPDAPQMARQDIQKPVHPAAQINQIGGLPTVTESLRSSHISANTRVIFYTGDLCGISAQPVGRWEPVPMTDFPCLERVVSRSGAARYRLGHPLVDRYLEFVAGRARPNTLRAVAFDLKVFFTVVAKDPVAVAAVDVFEFLAHQRGDRTVCGWLTGSLGCRHGRSRAGCRRCRAGMGT